MKFKVHHNYGNEVKVTEVEADSYYSDEFFARFYEEVIRDGEVKRKDIIQFAIDSVLVVEGKD